MSSANFDCWQGQNLSKRNCGSFITNNIAFRCTGSGYDKERFYRLNFFFAFQFTLSGRNDSKEKRNRRKTLLSQSTSRRKGVSAAENCVKVSFLSVTSDFRNYSYFLLTQLQYFTRYNTTSFFPLLIISI